MKVSLDDIFNKFISIIHESEQHYLDIKDSIHNAALEALGTYENNTAHRNPYWWDEEIEKDIEEK